MRSYMVLSNILLFVCMTLANPTLPPGGIGFQNCTRPNEFYDCGSACDTECATLGEVCKIVNIRCNDWCYCIKGYARNSTWDCIPKSECPKKN